MVTFDDIVAGALSRGLTVADFDDMDIGDVVDYCITYNNNIDTEKKDDEERRQATQEDWDNFM